MASGIYQIENQVNGNCYIGSSATLRYRRKQHLSDLRCGRHPNPHLQAAFMKYGEAAFVFSILEYIEPQLLIAREQHYLDTLKPEYNILPVAGSTLGYQHTEGARRKIGAAMTPGRREALGKRWKGMHLSVEHRRKIGAARKGKRHSEETKRKMSKAKSGKHLSEDTRRKISEAEKGKQLSEGHKRKISEAQKARWRRVRAAEKQ